MFQRVFSISVCTDGKSRITSRPYTACSLSKVRTVCTTDSSVVHILYFERLCLKYCFPDKYRVFVFCCRALFNAGFLSCWTELNETQQDDMVQVIETALRSPDVPAEVTHTLLNLAEFMEHTDKVASMY